MFWFADIPKLIADIQRDVTIFVSKEIRLYLSDKNHKTLEQSMIGNLALFDLTTLAYKKGYDHMETLLTTSYVNGVPRRLNELLHMLTIKYGRKLIKRIRNESIKSMPEIYSIDKLICNRFDREFVTFWLIPFIKQGYNEIITQYKEQ